MFSIRRGSWIRGMSALNDQPAPDGSTISVMSGDVECGVGTVVNGAYAIDADCEAGPISVLVNGIPQRTLTIQDDATYDLPLEVRTEFSTVVGTQSQLWTGNPVQVGALESSLPAQVVAVFEWNSDGQRFDFWFRGFPSSFQTLSGGLRTGKNYFIQATGPGQVSIPGGESFVLAAGGDVSMPGGVNGLLWNGQVIGLEEIPTTLPAEVSAVFGWNNASQRFDFWFRGFPSGFQVLQDLHAWQYYFFQVTGAATLHVPFGPTQNTAP
jgi:hypothetical protein